MTSVGLELIIGLALALALNRAFRGRGLVRAAVLIPWAIPTVVSALLWRFMFEGQSGIVNALLVDLGVLREPIVWLIDPVAAWVPGRTGRRLEAHPVRGTSTACRPAEHRHLPV